MKPWERLRNPLGLLDEGQFGTTECDGFVTFKFDPPDSKGEPGLVLNIDGMVFNATDLRELAEFLEVSADQLDEESGQL